MKQEFVKYVLREQPTFLLCTGCVFNDPESCSQPVDMSCSVGGQFLTKVWVAVPADFTDGEGEQ